VFGLQDRRFQILESDAVSSCGLCHAGLTLAGVQYHLENPYWKTFDPYVIPLLAKDMDLRRYNELDTSTEVRVEKDPKLWEAVKEHQTY
jgi:hypothetical protein